ncbi:MAG: aminotransferase class V-fold PLP-dependent enzyme [Firmicutes bacterium]|nr:aminotransferase class V-fold PLP-dependent enzyme [Bacillota bacterium]
MTTKAPNLYFDNAATTWPKPESVCRAVEANLRQSFGNPGRSGLSRSLESDRVVYQTRQKVADFFHIEDPSRLVFAFNATDALNMAIKGLLNRGDHVIFTAMEHNSVLRPLGSLRRDGFITTTAVPCDKEGRPDLDYLEKAFTPRTKLVICSHASNVTGTILPVDTICLLAHQKGAFLLVDAAQSAGVLPIDLSLLEADLLAFTGHKGLLGPPGTGGLYVREGIDLKPWREGGTGSFSEEDLQPQVMPEKMEAGTLNTTGLAGLQAGIEFIQETGIDEIRRHELKMRRLLKSKLLALPGLTVYGPADDAQCVGVLSFTVEGVDCGELGRLLEDPYGIITRTGLHCAPLAHKAIGTFPQGTVRLSPGYFTREEDVERVALALEEILRVKV